MTGAGAGRETGQRRQDDHDGLLHRVPTDVEEQLRPQGFQSDPTGPPLSRPAPAGVSAVLIRAIVAATARRLGPELPGLAPPPLDFHLNDTYFVVAPMRCTRSPVWISAPPQWPAGRVRR